MSRITAPDRLRRVLAVVPWIMANPGQKVADIAERFGSTEQALLDDLAVVFMVGLPPYSPDALVEVLIDEGGRVSIDLAEFFSRPLRLTPGQGLALLAASEALLSVPGTESNGPLACALQKLGASLGVRRDAEQSNLDVSLGDVEARVLTQLRKAVGERCSAEIDYYSYGRDSMSSRVISPWRVFSDSGAWYVHAWCNSAQGERIFRLDRIAKIEASDHISEHRPDDDDSLTGVFHPNPNDARIKLELAADVAWVVEAYPCESVAELADGSVKVTMVITAEAWLYRLLLRLGSECKILEAPEGLEIEAGLRKTAAKILERYHP